MKKIFYLVFGFLALSNICLGQAKNEASYIKITHIGISDKPIEDLFILTDRQTKFKHDSYSTSFFIRFNDFNTVVSFVKGYVPGVDKSPNDRTAYEYGSFNISVYNQKGLILKKYNLSHVGESRGYFAKLINLLNKDPFNKSLAEELKTTVRRITF